MTVMAGADTFQMLQKVGLPESNIVTIAPNADAISTLYTRRADGYAAVTVRANELAGRAIKSSSRPISRTRG